MLQLGKWTGSFADPQNSCMNGASFTQVSVIVAALALYNYHIKTLHSPSLMQMFIYLLAAFEQVALVQAHKWGQASKTQFFDAHGHILKEKNFSTCLTVVDLSRERPDKLRRKRQTGRKSQVSSTKRSLSLSSTWRRNVCFILLRKGLSFSPPSVGGCSASRIITHVQEQNCGSYVSSGSLNAACRQTALRSYLFFFFFDSARQERVCFLLAVCTNMLSLAVAYWLLLEKLQLLAQD